MVVLRTLALDATMVLTVVSGLHYAWARRAGGQRPPATAPIGHSAPGHRTASKRVPARRLKASSGDYRPLALPSVFFNLHVAKLFGVKDFATLQALDILGVFVPGDDSYPGVFAGGCHRFVLSVGMRCSFRQIVAVFSAISNGNLLNRLDPSAKILPRWAAQRCPGRT